MPKRILAFTPDHNEQGGAGRVSYLLTSALAENGWDVRVITRASRAWRFRLRGFGRLKVLEIPGFGLARGSTVLFLAFGLLTAIPWGLRAHVLFARQLVAPSVLAALSSAVLRKPYVAAATTSGAFSEAAYLREPGARRRGPWPALAYRVDRWLRLRLLRRSAFVVAQTEAGAEELAEVLPRERIVVIPNPVELVQAPPLTGLARFVYTGRLSRDKDIATLLRAWPAVVTQRPEARLTLVGAGGEHESVEDDLRAWVDRDPVLRESVSFTGWVTDVSPFLAESDVFVLPSLTEGISQALLEACAWGRVVVASEIPSIRSVLGDSYPLLFPPGEDEQLAQALTRALQDEPTRALATKLASAAVESLSPEQVAKRFDGILSGAMAGSSRAAPLGLRPSGWREEW